MPNWPEMQVQVEKTEAGKQLTMNDKQDMKTINDFLGKSKQDVSVKAVLESKKPNRDNEAQNLWVDKNVLNAYDNLKNNIENRVKFLTLKDMPTFDSKFVSIDTNNAELSPGEKSVIEGKVKSIMDGIKNDKYVIDKINIIAKESQVPSNKFPNPFDLANQRWKLTKAYLEELATTYLNGDKNKVAEFMGKVNIIPERGVTPYDWKTLPWTPEYATKYAIDEWVNIKIDYKEKLMDPSLDGVSIRVIIADESEHYNNLEKKWTVTEVWSISWGVTHYNKWQYKESFARIGGDGKVAWWAQGLQPSRFDPTDDGNFIDKQAQKWNPIADNNNNAGKTGEALKPQFFLSLNATNPADQQLIADYQNGKMHNLEWMKTLLSAYVNQQEKYYGERINNLTPSLNSPELSALRFPIPKSTHDHSDLYTAVENASNAEKDPVKQKNLSSLSQQLYAMTPLANNVVMAEDYLKKMV